MPVEEFRVTRRSLASAKETNIFLRIIKSEIKIDWIKYNWIIISVAHFYVILNYIFNFFRLTLFFDARREVNLFLIQL